MSIAPELKALQDVYSNMVKEKQDAVAKEVALNEGINDHEALHKSIIAKFHKHYPDMNLDKAVHKSKSTMYGNETHVYSAQMPVHSSVSKLFKTLHAKVVIHHHESGSHHAKLAYEWEHHGGGQNGHEVAAMGSDHGALHIRDNATGVMKKA